jgi:hypothetical protein
MKSPAIDKGGFCFLREGIGGGYLSFIKESARLFFFGAPESDIDLILILEVGMSFAGLA